MIIYFSGTGNSRYAAHMLAELIGDDVIDAGKLIRSGEYPTLISERPWVFAAPVYGWRLPKLFDKWIRKAELNGSRKAYFLLTCGSDIGNAQRYLRSLCRKKKLEFLGVKGIVMPENYAAMFEVPQEETSVKIRRNAEHMISRVSNIIAEEKPIKRGRISISDRFKSSVINPAFYTFCVKSKAFHVKDNCISCGKCAENCPMNGIIMKDGKPVWTGACTHCMACLCGCPTEAIEYGRRSVGKVRYQCPEYKAKEKTAESASEEKTVQPMNGDTKIMMKYTQQFEIPAESFDENANLVPSQVLSVFQTLADRHAAILGVDFDKMYSRGFLWVITQIKYQVCGELKPGETVTGVTWPLPPSRLAYDREYLICGEDGNTIIKGTSNWVLIDVKERRIASAENVYPEGEHCTDKNFSEKLRRLRDFEATGEPCRICPDESHIDANGHVNNTKYADFVRTALGGFSREIDVFQIDYINEVMCGQPLDICCTATENGAAAKGISEEGKRMFACSVTYK